MPKMDDLTDRTFGRLTATVRSERRWSDKTYVYYDCQCSCGGKRLHVRSDALRNGRTQSCGCLYSWADQVARRGA